MVAEKEVSSLEGTTLKNWSTPVMFISQTGEWIGYLADMFSLLQSQLGFTNTYEYSIDGTPGILGPEGNWSGIMGMLERKEIDFSIQGNTMLPQRTQVFAGSLVRHHWQMAISPTKIGA